MASSSTPWWKEPTREQWIAYLAAWAGWVLDAFDFTVFLLVMPKIAAHFGVPLTAVASTITLTLLTRLVGGVAAGALADRYGRKLPLVLSVAWFALCDGAVALAPSFTWVLILRVLFGFGMGAQWTSGTTMAMESWPARSRGLASGILQGSWAIGYLAAAWVARLVLGQGYSWRAIFVVAALPALLVLPLQLRAKESRDLHGGVQAPAVPLQALFTPDLRRRLAWGSLSMALGLAVYYAFTGLHATLLQTELHLPLDEAMDLVALFNLGMLGGSVVFGAIAKRKGVVAAIVTPALASLLVIPLFVGAVPSLLPVGSFLIGAVGVGWCGTVPIYLTSLFPAAVRGRAVGIAYHVGAVLAAAVPPAITELSRALAPATAAPLAWSIALIAGGGLLALVVVLLIQPKALTGSALAPAPQVAPAVAVEVA